MVTTAGEISSNSSCFTIDMIPVEANSTYHIPNARNTAILNSAGEIINSWSGGAIESAGSKVTTTADTVYIRTCCYYSALTPEQFTITKV